MKASSKALHGRIDEIVERLYGIETSQPGLKKRSASPSLVGASLDGGATHIKANAELETRLLHIEDKMNSFSFR